MTSHPDPFHDPRASEGAVDLTECQLRNTGRWKSCKCEFCARCGQRKHVAVHGPFYGEPPGSKPWGHKFVDRSVRINHNFVTHRTYTGIGCAICGKPEELHEGISPENTNPSAPKPQRDATLKEKSVEGEGQ